MNAAVSPPSHVIEPSVAMNASTPRPTITNALIAPNAAAPITARMTAGITAMWSWVVSTAIRDAEATITAATDRSKSPARSGIVSAMARIRITACPSSVIFRLVLVKNSPGSAIVNPMIRTTRTTRSP